MADLSELVGGLRLLPLSHQGDFYKFIEDVKKAKKTGQKLFIVFLCCPDYSYKIDSSGWGTFNYEELNYGPGMVALVYARAFLDIVKELKRHNVKGKIILAYGDDEVEDQSRLRALGVNKDKFIQCVRCSQSAARIFYEDLSREVEIDSLGMNNRFYLPKIKKLAKKKLDFITKKEVEEIVKTRKKVITDTYRVKYENAPKFFYDKARRQIFDRLIIGTALSIEREKGKLISVLTLTIPSLRKFFNFKNNQYVPVLTVGAK